VNRTRNPSACSKVPHQLRYNVTPNYSVRTVTIPTGMWQCQSADVLVETYRASWSLSSSERSDLCSREHEASITFACVAGDKYIWAIYTNLPIGLHDEVFRHQYLAPRAFYLLIYTHTHTNTYTGIRMRDIRSSTGNLWPNIALSILGFHSLKSLYFTIYISIEYPVLSFHIHFIRSYITITLPKRPLCPILPHDPKLI
jgi:hypothetical protein